MRLLAVMLSLTLSSCATVHYSTEYYRHPDTNQECLNSYGGMDGYCSGM